MSLIHRMINSIRVLRQVLASAILNLETEKIYFVTNANEGHIVWIR